MRAAVAALAFAALAAAPASAQRIIDSPRVAGLGFARCTDVVRVADNPNVRSHIAQWALGYYSGLLALDIEGAVPAYDGLSAWFEASEGADLESVGDRIVAQCQADPSLNVEVASQRVAISLAAEAR